MPLVLVLLAVIALVLYIVFTHLLPPGIPTTPNGRCLVAWIIVVLILIFWFVLPIRIGP